MRSLCILFLLIMPGAGCLVQFQNEVIIDRPVDQVYVGSTCSLTFENDSGETIELEERVIAVEPQQRFAFEIEHESMVSTTQVVFVRLEHGRTRLISQVEVRGKGFLWRILVRLSKSTIQKRDLENLQGLQAMLEGKRRML